MYKQKQLLLAATAALMAGVTSPAMAEWGLNLMKGVTTTSQAVYDLHMLIFWICVVIAIVVYGAMFISIMNHRKDKGAVAANFHESTFMEILWTIVPIGILVFMAVPATKVLLDMEDTSGADINIKVTGIQWKWQYDYLDEGISFVSTLDEASNAARQLDSGVDVSTVPDYLLNVDRPLVIPTGKKVRFLLTANDVIHAWWVPDFGWKKDAVPGYINEAWTKVDEPGIYRGQCAELCGRDHGFMPIVVEVKTPEDYAAWVAEQKGEAKVEAATAEKEWDMDGLMEKGKAVYASNCAACHGANGEGVAGAFPPMTNSPIANGDMNAHVDMVMNGSKANPAMSAFKNILSDVDLAAVITYERNAFGNTAGDMIQPAAIKAAR